MGLGWRSLRGRRILLILGLGLIVVGFAGIYAASLPLERTVVYEGPFDGSIVVGQVPGRIDWIGGGHISVQFNATGGAEERYLFWMLAPGPLEFDQIVYGSESANCSISHYPLPWDRDLDIVLVHEWNEELPYVTAEVHWRVTGFDPDLLLLSTLALIIGFPVVAVGRKKKQKLESLAEFEKRVKL